jgi:hypothetical protein
MNHPPDETRSEHEGIDTSDSLVRWAADQGVKLYGIKPRDTAEHGFGMMATRDLRVVGCHAIHIPMC